MEVKNEMTRKVVIILVDYDYHLIKCRFCFEHNTHRIKKCLSLVKAKRKIQRRGGRGKKNFFVKSFNACGH
jgi:hypothetical protein